MRCLFIIIILCLCQSAHTQNNTIKASSEIKNVTVFSSGARIERTATAQVTPGRTEVSFYGLSNQLDPQSVQLSSNSRITLLSVQAARDFVSERKIGDDEKRFLDSIASISRQKRLSEKMLEVYKYEESMLAKNQSIGGQAGVKTADLKEALDLQTQRLTELYKKQLEIERQIEQQENKLKKLREQLQEFSKKKDSVNYIVTALIESKSAANISFILSYNIKDAGWYPTYDVRLQDINAPLDFLMNANVFQRSGETWKNVSLQLSTGSPNENATPTELQPWNLGFFNPLAASRTSAQRISVTGRVTGEDGEPIAYASIMVRGSTNGALTDVNGFFRLNEVPFNATVQVSAVGYDPKEIKMLPGYTSVVLKKSETALEEVVVTGYGALQGKVSGVNVNKLKKEDKSIELVDVSTQYAPTTLIYNIEEKYSIETDGKTTTIGVKNIEVPALFRYLSVPKADPSSFLTAYIPDWQEYDLQSGEAGLYFEGTYLGKTYIDLATASDTLSLSMGKDNGVRVKRQLIKEFSRKRFIGSNQTDSRQYEISVRNNKKEAVEITIQDQYPISITKDITVSDVKAPSATIDEKTGLVSWDIRLNPGEERKLLLSFVVKYPKDRRVVLE